LPGWNGAPRLAVRRRTREATASMTEADRSTQCVGDHAEAMAEIVQAIATQQTLEDLHRALARALKKVVPFDLLAVIQADLERRTVRPRLNEGQLPPGAVQPELPLDQVPEGELLRTRKALVVPDINLETR